MKFFKSLDFFTKAKEEVDSSTTIGGLFSILGVLCGALFLILEVTSFMKYSVVKEMSVRSGPPGKEEKMNIDIYFLNAPCNLISMIREEEGGQSILMKPPQVQKQRLNGTGHMIGTFVVHDQTPEDELETTINAINNKEGCRFFGNFSVKEFPGHLRFDFKDKIDIYRRLKPEQAKSVSLAFVLAHLTFGQNFFHPVILRRYPKEVFTPYDGLSMKDTLANEKISMYTKVVSNSYTVKGLKNYTTANAFQFSARYQKKEVLPLQSYLHHFQSGRVEIPAFQLNYEFSPINILHKRVSNSFSRFLVDTLAIVGGIFSVMGMLNNLTLTRFKHLRNL